MSEVWLLNVTMNDISVIHVVHVTAQKCWTDFRSGSRAIDIS